MALVAPHQLGDAAALLLCQRQQVGGDDEGGLFCVRLVHVGAQVVKIGLKEALKEFPDPDDATLKMIRTAIREGPLRVMVQLGGGRVNFAALDSAIEAFNGHWSKLASRVGRSRSRPSS